MHDSIEHVMSIINEKPCQTYGCAKRMVLSNRAQAHTLLYKSIKIFQYRYITVKLILKYFTKSLTILQ